MATCLQSGLRRPGQGDEGTAEDDKVQGMSYDKSPIHCLHALPVDML